MQRDRDDQSIPPQSSMDIFPSDQAWWQKDDDEDQGGRGRKKKRPKRR
jgi:hypothetical protein